MPTRDEQRERVVQRLSAHLLETGLSQISLRQLAAAARVSDRMLLYYFEDKAAVLAAAMERVAFGLADEFGKAMPPDEKLTPPEFLKHAAMLTTQTGMRRFMRLWIEVVAAAAKGEAPFVAIAAQIMAGFQIWVDSRLDVPAGTDRAAVAAAIIAMVDGLALVGVCSDDELVARAVGGLHLLSA